MAAVGRAGLNPPAADPILVAGAGGFIGANLVRDLLGRGARVHGLVRPGSGLGRLEGLGEAFTLHRADGADRTAVRDCLRRVRPRAVFNLMRSRGDPGGHDALAPLNDNVVAAANLLEAAGRSGCARFVQFGSSTEFQAGRGPVDESTPIQPATVHAATKAAASLVCRELATEMGIGLTLLRPFQVYGPWDEAAHLVPAAIAAALEGGELSLAPGGRRDWVFVDDVCEAAVLALEADVEGEDVNLGTGRQSSNEQVVDAIAEVMGIEICVRADERSRRAWDREDWVADISKARALLGWTPRHDLRAGLRKTIDWEAQRIGRRRARTRGRGLHAPGAVR